MEPRIDRKSTDKDCTTRERLQHSGVLVRLCICLTYSYMGQAIHLLRGHPFGWHRHAERRVRQASLRRGLSFDGGSVRRGVIGLGSLTVSIRSRIVIWASSGRTGGAGAN